MLIHSKSPNCVNAYIFRSLAISGLNYDYVSVACGAFDPYIFLFWLFGKKCLRLWTGTDSIKAVWFWDYRLRAKVCSWFCNNIAVSQWLADNVNSAGIKCDGVLDFYEHFGLFTKKAKKKA